MANIYLDNLPISPLINAKFNEVFGLKKSLFIENGEYVNSTKTATGQCTIYGIDGLSIEVKVNPSATKSLNVNLTKSGTTFSIPGLEWLEMNDIQFSLSIPKDISVTPTGTVTANLVFPSITLTGTLEELPLTSFGGNPDKFEWQMISPDIDDIPFNSVIKNVENSSLSNIFNEVKGILSSVIKKLEILVGSESHSIILHTPFSFDVVNNIKLDNIRACLSAPNYITAEAQKKLSLKGVFENSSGKGLQIELGFAKFIETILYEINIHSTEDEGLSMDDVLGDTFVNDQSAWLPNSWENKLRNTSLKSLDLQYVPSLSLFRVASKGIFLSVPTIIKFSLSKFMGKSYVNFSGYFFKAPVSIQDMLKDDLGVQVSNEVSNWLPTIKVALTEIGFDQLNQKFDVSANLELGKTDPIKAQGNLQVQWINGIDLNLGLSFNGSPLSFDRVLSSVDLDFSHLSELIPQEMTNHILATSFRTLGIGVNTQTKSFAFCGNANLFGEWDVYVNFQSHLRGEKRFISFGADIQGLDISFRQIPEKIGFSDGTEAWLNAIPNISVAPKLFRFDQEAKSFAVGVDFRFDESLLITYFEVTHDNDKRNILLSFLSDKSNPVSFIGLLSTLLPKFEIKEEDIPFDVILDSLNLNFQTVSEGNRVSGFVKGSLRLANAKILLDIHSINNSENEWQFVGNMEPGSPILIGDFMDSVIQKFGATPLPKILSSTIITTLNLSFNSKSKDISFSFETQIDLGAEPLDVIISLEITHVDGLYTKMFSGIVKIDNLEFDLVFKQEEGADTVFLAAYENHAGGNQNIKPLVELITTNQDIIDASENMSFNLKDALLVIDKGDSTKVLFGLDIGGGLDISKLPLVGKMLPDNSTIKMTLQPLLTNSNFTTTELDSVRPLVPAGGYQLPKKDITDRLGFNIQLVVGDQTYDLSLPINVDTVKTQPKPSATPTTPATPTIPATSTTSNGTVTANPPSTSDNVKWFKIQKKVGPVDFGRVGVQFKDGKLYILLDASLSLAGLTISLDSLYVSSELNPIHPTFGLHGMGIDYKKGPLEIGGAFLRQTVTDPNGVTYDSYDGTAIIRTEAFALAALGSYAYYKGHPSLFIYAFLDVPLGGPAFFFVTGLAAGFGYNRRIIVPSLEGVRTFPLVEEAMSGVPGTTNDLSDEIQKLHTVIPPAVGEYFLAIGIRFSSFEIIDSFLLLTVSFGIEFEIDVLGLSTLVLPTPEVGSTIEPLAEIQLALKAVFNPDRGYLKVRAGLTSQSFILSRNCHLTGGFAFYTWFKDNPDEGASAGDFVLTLGGYHPRFKPPAYYPRVAPLGFNWKVTDELVVKGDFYFALVPSAVMAGGHLSATWSSGHLKAWFTMGADFIISWKPYFYDASMYLDMGVSYTYHFFGTHHISVDVGADLHIWGPEFSGKAHVHLWIVTFNVAFGSSSNPSPPVLDWSDFRDGFLPPEKEKWATLSVTKGLVEKLGTDSEPIYMVNPKEISFETGAVIPITESTHFTATNSASIQKNIHIGSMKINGKNDSNGAIDNTDKITSDYTITIKKGTDDITSHFTITPILKNVPSALWGEKFKHSESEGDDERVVKNACMGFSIIGKPPIASDGTHDVDVQKLLNENVPFGKDIAYESHEALGGKFLKTDMVKESIAEHIEKQDSQRNELLKSLGFVETFHPNKELVDELILTV